MSDGRCATCRHWEEPGDQAFKSRRHGSRLCMLAETTGGGELHPDSLAFAIDDSFRCGTLETSPAFGCVQHEPRTA